MSRVLILGAGISGHTAALHLKRRVGGDHEVIVVSPNSMWNWIPSNIWVGVGRMETDQVTFPLAPIYRRKGIEFHQALATEIHPEGNHDVTQPFVRVRYTDPRREGEIGTLTYDYLINATGPKLNFAATPGLGPDGNSLSVCTAGHAREAAEALQRVIEELRQGKRQTLVIGMGHGTCTCEGAAFEYTLNVEHELRKAGVRERAEVIYLSNEYELGDFGVGGLTFDQEGYVTNSKLWTESLFRERGVKALLRAHVERVEPGKLSYELLDGTKGELSFDFAMLLPPFRGADLHAFDREGKEITEVLFAPNGFLRVDADYTARSFEEWSAQDWPLTYRSPHYEHVFAVGIAFAPPHAISRPRVSSNGTPIAPAPPRTGMPSGVMGRVVAEAIADRLRHGGKETSTHHASMASMGAACFASAGSGLLDGSAAAMTMFPIVPDVGRYPTGGGRDLRETTGEIGLSGHWTKLLLHYLFIYKAKARPGWYLIPE
ncbi:MAG: NAD(P)/FAD-dependent oxidoreductase [Acidimicrobiales bacterium]